MSLLNKNSQLDLIQGNNAVNNMETTQGTPFDLGIGSSLQPDSLSEVPTVSLYQDLDGAPGPLFDNGINSPIHAFTIANIPAASNELPYAINFSPYQSNVSPGASYNSNWPTVFSTNMFGDPQMPSPSAMFAGLSSDTAVVQETLLGLPGENFPQNSQFQDLNGNPGPQFNGNPPYDQQQQSLHVDSILNAYESAVNQGASYLSNWPEVGPSNLDANNNPPGFDNGSNPPYMHEDLLANIYTSTVNPDASYGGNFPGWPNVGPGTYDLNSNPGPQIDGNPPYDQQQQSLHVDMLADIYTSTVNSGTPSSPFSYNSTNYPSVGPGTFDLNGAGTIGEATFDNGIGNGENSLHTDMLADMYTSNINPLASYVGNWPNVGPGTFDLNGGVPSRGKYVDNAPEGAYI